MVTWYGLSSKICRKSLIRPNRGIRHFPTLCVEIFPELSTPTAVKSDVGWNIRRLQKASDGVWLAISDKICRRNLIGLNPGIKDFPTLSMCMIFQELSTLTAVKPALQHEGGQAVLAEEKSAASITRFGDCYWILRMTYRQPLVSISFRLVWLSAVFYGFMIRIGYSKQDVPEELDWVE